MNLVFLSYAINTRIMKIFYPILISILIGWLVSNQSLFGQQTPIFHQYTFSPELYNPARIGENGGGSVMFVHRQEWLNIKDAPASQIFSINYRLSNKSPLALGIVAKNDKAGLIKRTDAALFLGYHLGNPRDRFSVGIYGGFNSMGIALSDINVGFDPAASLSGDRMTKMDAGLGVNFHHHDETSSLDIGIASTQIPGTFELSDENTNLQFDFVNHILATASWRYKLNSQFAIEPILSFRTLPGAQKLKGGDVDAFLRAHIGNRIGVGVGYRPEAGSLFAMLSMNFTVDARSKFVAVGDYNPELDYSYELAASAGFGEMIDEENIEPVIKKPKPKKIKPDPKPIVTKDNPRKRPKVKESEKENEPLFTRNDFWNRKPALIKKLHENLPPNFADLEVVIGLKGTEVILTYPDESSSYLITKPSYEDRLITWTSTIIKSILRQDVSPHLDKIDSLVLVGNFADPSSIVESEVAELSYRGEYGSSLNDSYLFDGEKQEISLTQSTDLLFLHEFSFLKLYDIRDAIARSLKMNRSDIKIKLYFEQAISTSKQIQIRIYLPMIEED